jgi:hypothetical protein
VKLTCPCCGANRAAGQYLCRRCWFRLPYAARLTLQRRDDQAMARLQELHTQLADRVPLAEIRITP